jgi:hypothetical protein
VKQHELGCEIVRKSDGKSMGFFADKDTACVRAADLKAASIPARPV